MVRAEVATREQLIDTAARILAADGLGGLSTRRLAGELGVSTMVVYTRFGSMPELLEAVVIEGFERQAARLEAVPESADPVADLVALGLAYRANAVDNPHLYAIMYAGAGEPKPRTDQAKSTRDLFTAAATRAVAAGALAADDAAVVADQLLSAVHGFVSLELAGVFAGRSKPEETVLAALLARLLA